MAGHELTHTKTQSRLMRSFAFDQDEQAAAPGGGDVRPGYGRQGKKKLSSITGVVLRLEQGDVGRRGIRECGLDDIGPGCSNPGGMHARTRLHPWPLTSRVCGPQHPAPEHYYTYGDKKGAWAKNWAGTLANLASLGK